MAKGKVKTYDDEQLVQAIARGDRTYEQIGEALGLSADHVRKIAQGQRRPALQPRIDAAVQGCLDQARRLGARMAVAAMTRLGRIIAGDTDRPAAVLEVQRKAALDVLRIAFEWSDRKQQAQADAEAAAAAAAQKPEPVVVEHRLTGSHLAQLSEDTLARVCRELGWDDYDDDSDCGRPGPDPTAPPPESREEPVPSSADAPGAGPPAGRPPKSITVVPLAGA
ncbi:MAG: hypothetical protein ACYS5V_03770 [Planctomycetota bacterium]